jgi:ABC-2 type transport system ATP-binding protein
VIELQHIVKKYGQTTVVDDLNLTIKPGRIYGFLGPNGAGKTTTMNIITGYLAASSGTVTVNGIDILMQPEKAKKHIGYLPEQPPLYVDMKVGEYLRFAAEIKQVAKGEREQAVADAMSKAHVADVSNRLIRNLSKGYKQRVGLAQAILGDPEVVILDEPTVGLDPSQIIEIRQLIKQLGKQHTVILSSHILSEVTEVCDYIFIIANGRLVANDSTANLLKDRHGNFSEIEVLVKGDGNKEKEALSKYSTQFRSVRVMPSSRGESLIRIKVASKMDRRQEYLKALMRAESEVLEYRTIGQSLEETFLELTNRPTTGSVRKTSSSDRDAETIEYDHDDAGEIETLEPDPVVEAEEPEPESEPVAEAEPEAPVAEEPPPKKPAPRRKPKPKPVEESDSDPESEPPAKPKPARPRTRTTTKPKPKADPEPEEAEKKPATTRKRKPKPAAPKEEGEA